MSDSDDDMPMIARRRPQGEAHSAAVAEKPPAPTTAPVKQDKGPQPTAASETANQGNAQQHQNTEADVKPPPVPAEHVKPAAVKQEADQDSSDESDDDLPLAARSKATGDGAATDRTAENGHKAANHKHQASQKSDAEAKESKPAANRRSSDAGAKKAAANGQAAAKQQKDIKPEKQPANKAAGAAAKKSSAVKTEKAAATNAAAKQQRVKKEFDLPGQTRETPDETDPLRKFYTSLLQEKPGSFMARKWCVMNGLLSREEAEEFVKQNKGGRAAAATPTKAAAKRPAASAGRKAPAAKKAAAGDARPKAKAAPKRKAAAKKKDKLDWDDSESEEADDDSSSDDDVPLAQRKSTKT